MEALCAPTFSTFLLSGRYREHGDQFLSLE